MSFHSAMTIAEALAVHPSARWVFAAYQLNGCIGCPEKERETIAYVAESYQLPLERLMSDLNSLMPTS